jgi:hypothetical protein
MYMRHTHSLLQLRQTVPDFLAGYQTQSINSEILNFCTRQTSIILREDNVSITGSVSVVRWKAPTQLYSLEKPNDWTAESNSLSG